MLLLQINKGNMGCSTVNVNKTDAHALKKKFCHKKYGQRIPKRYKFEF